MFEYLEFTRHLTLLAMITLLMVIMVIIMALIMALHYIAHGHKYTFVENDDDVSIFILFYGSFVVAQVPKTMMARAALKAATI